MAANVTIGAGGDNDNDTNMIDFEVAYAGCKYSLSLPATSTLFDLKDELYLRFNISPAAQKLLGFPTKISSASTSSTITTSISSSTPSTDPSTEVLLASLNLKSPAKIILMGTPDTRLAAHNARMALAAEAAESDVLNDMVAADDGDDDDAEGITDESKNPLFLSRIQRRISTYKPKMLAGFRPNKKTLVLDIDYTLIDHRSTVSHPFEMARPFLHEFFKHVYAHYNIVIWSATNMKWIDLKLAEMGLLSHPDDFQIACCFDHHAMITIMSTKYGLVDVKPLPVIWGLFPRDTNPNTTVMCDDLRRNFLMNPLHGIRVSACRSLPTTRHMDVELRDLAIYIGTNIATESSFQEIDHRKWRKCICRSSTRTKKFYTFRQSDTTTSSSSSTPSNNNDDGEDEEEEDDNDEKKNGGECGGGKRGSGSGGSGPPSFP